MSKRAKQNQIPKGVFWAGGVFLLSCILLAYTLLTMDDRAGRFVPPPFETEAVAGFPAAPEELGWSEVFHAQMDFKAGICGIFQAGDGKVEAWFANLSQKPAWIKLRILDDRGTVIGETGLLKNGEYVERVALTELPDDGSMVTYKIMAYEPETYYSLGSVNLKTVVDLGGE